MYGSKHGRIVDYECGCRLYTRFPNFVRELAEESRAMDLRIDHVTLCGSHLEDMRRSFADAGLATTYGGRHANGVTHMDLLAFADGSYLELIAPIASLGEATGLMSGWAKLMDQDAGPGAWAAQTSDIHADAVRLRAAGIEVRGPEAGSRQRPDGTRIEWETAIVGPGSAGSVLPFLIQDKTPRHLRVPKPSNHNTIPGVAAVVIAVHRLDESIALFQRAFHLGEPIIENHSDFGAQLGHFVGIPVILAAPDSEASWLADRLKRFGECPGAFLLEEPPVTSTECPFELNQKAFWFGRNVGWIDSDKLHGARLGFID